VELIRLIDRVRHRHPHTLYATTAWTGIEDAATTARFTPRWAAHSERIFCCRRLRRSVPAGLRKA
jgi:hypothetical protein